MFRKMFFNLFTILVLSTVVIIACIAKQKIGLIKNFFEENKKIEIIQKFVEKKYVYIDPDVKDFIIPDIVAVKRFVYLLNKNGWILIPQKTFSVLHEIKIDNSITLTEEQISGKISYKKLNMQLYPNLIGKGFDSKEIATKREKIESFDNDLDIYVFGEYKIKKDIFKQLNNNTLVNSVEINNPQIGDIKMEYEIFSPNYVVLFKNTTNNSLYLNKTIFTDEVYNPIQPYLVEIVIIIIFILYNNIVFIMLFTSTINIRRYAKKFVLNYIPFFGEYMIFSSVYVFVFFVTTLSMLFIISIRAFTIILLAFICVINRDYYSV